MVSSIYKRPGEVSNELRMILYTDDTNIFISGPNINQLETKLNLEMDQLFNWLKPNRLSLKAEKNHCMVFKPQPRTHAH